MICSQRNRHGCRGYVSYTAESPLGNRIDIVSAKLGLTMRDANNQAIPGVILISPTAARFVDANGYFWAIDAETLALDLAAGSWPSQCGFYLVYETTDCTGTGYVVRQ